MTEDEEYSYLRHLLIPDIKNTLQSASYQHSRGEYDKVEESLELAKKKIDKCIEQNRRDKRDAQDRRKEQG
jgi:hypothetical protein